MLTIFSAWLSVKAISLKIQDQGFAKIVLKDVLDALLVQTVLNVKKDTISMNKNAWQNARLNSIKFRMLDSATIAHHPAKHANQQLFVYLALIIISTMLLVVIVRIIVVVEVDTVVAVHA